MPGGKFVCYDHCMGGFRFLLGSLFLLCSIGIATANAADGPLPRVGRVSAAAGAFAVRPVGGEWIAAGINDPIAAGMSVRITGPGRAELRVGAETIALAGGSELDIGRLDTEATQLVLRRGRLGMRLPTWSSQRSIEIDLPTGGVWPLTPGDYDIDASDAPARVAVLEGRVRLVGNALDSTIATGSASLLRGGDPVVTKLDAAEADDFVTWWRSAAKTDADLPALRYVSAETTGYEALNGKGAWETVAGYGAVWFPQVAAEEWAPFRNGHWRWIAPWGWSWIDDMPWAFAPSHYGRWALVAGVDPLAPSDPGMPRWGWVPGRKAAHPAYAPAVVAFLGTAGVGISYADAVGPAVAWFPLAPGEVYWPGYTADLDAIRLLNQSAVPDAAALDAAIGASVSGEPPADIVNGDYRNRRYATIVPRAVFVGGRPVAAASLQLPPRRLDNAPLLAGSPQISPAPGRNAAVASATTGRPGATPGFTPAMTVLARILAPRGRTATRAVILGRAAAVRAASVVLAGRPNHLAAAHLLRRASGGSTPVAFRRGPLVRTLPTHVHARSAAARPRTGRNAA